MCMEESFDTTSNMSYRGGGEGGSNPPPLMKGIFIIKKLFTYFIQGMLRKMNFSIPKELNHSRLSYAFL